MNKKAVVEERQEEIRRFYLERTEDESGISGVGVVAVGAEFPSGRCVIEWRTVHSSIGIYNNITDVANIHGHQGKTKVVWGVPEVNKRRKKNAKVSKKVAKKK